jgi:hypothetical protein
MKTSRVFCLISCLIILLSVSAVADDINYVGSTLWNDIRDVEISGQYAYCVMANGLAVFNISNPQNPYIIFKEYFGAGGSCLFLSELYLYVARHLEGIRIYDLSNPAAPVLLAVQSTLGNPYGIYQYGNYLYVANFNNLQLIDVTDPANPVLAGQCPLTGYACAVQVVGNYAYMGTFNDGLQIVDVSDPNDPFMLGDLDLANPCYDIHVIGDYAYIANNTAGISIVDISDPMDPNFVGSIATGGTSFEMRVDGDYAYIADGDYGMHVLDISNPISPAAAAEYVTVGTANALFKAGNLLYISENNNGLEIVDISDLSSIAPVGYYNPKGAINVTVNDNIAYVSSASYGFSVVDISNRANPNVIGRYPTTGFSYASRISNGYAFIANGNELLVLDVYIPNDPVLATSLSMPDNIFNIHIDGSLAYLSKQNQGISIVDIANPYNPVLLSSYNTPGDARDVSVSGDYAYVADMNGGLLVLDIGDLRAPTSVSTTIFDGAARSVATYQNFAFVGCTNGSVYICDIIDPEGPLPVAEINFGSAEMGGINQVSVNGHYLCIAGQQGGFGIYDISDPIHPAEIGTYDTPGNAYSAVTSNGGIFVADDYSFEIFECPSLGIDEPGATLPVNYVATHNYPNPFNANTVISFTLGAESNVTLQMYDIMGRRIGSQSLGRYSAGSHNLNWDSHLLPSGVYFYRIATDIGTAFGKMTVLK